MSFFDDLYWEVHNFLHDEFRVIPFVSSSISSCAGFSIGIIVHHFFILQHINLMALSLVLIVLVFCCQGVCNSLRDWKAVWGIFSIQAKRAFFWLVGLSFVIIFVLTTISHFLLG